MIQHANVLAIWVVDLDELVVEEIEVCESQTEDDFSEEYGDFWAYTQKDAEDILRDYVQEQNGNGSKLQAARTCFSNTDNTPGSYRDNYDDHSTIFL